MYHRIREAKFRLETVTFVWDFLDHINPGDTIVGDPLIVILVSSGVDPTPSLLKFGEPIVSNGTVVSQKIHRGIPGTIYTVTITVHTEQGDVFEDLAYLAILPLPPLFFNFFLETQLYPIEMYYENITTEITLLSGKLFGTIIMVPEGITSELTLTSGTLFGAPLNYTMTVFGSAVNGDEAIISFITLISGTLHGGPVYYTMLPEGIQASINLIDGTLFGSPLDYALRTEGITSQITLVDGTLV